MELRVKGKGQISRTELMQAIPYIMKLMNAHRLLNNASILICFDKDLNNIAECDMNDRRDFEISINPKKARTYKSQIAALCHELVHVKQFARGHLDFFDRGARWKGKFYKLSRKAYWFRPWEVEAFGLENTLMSFYLHYADSQQKSVARRSRS